MIQRRRILQIIGNFKFASLDSLAEKIFVVSAENPIFISDSKNLTSEYDMIDDEIALNYLNNEDQVEIECPEVENDITSDFQLKNEVEVLSDCPEIEDNIESSCLNNKDKALSNRFVMDDNKNIKNNLSEAISSKTGTTSVCFFLLFF